MSIEPPAGSVPSIPRSSAAMPQRNGEWTVIGAICVVTLVMGSAMLLGLVLSQGFLVWRLGFDLAFSEEAANLVSASERRNLFLGIQLLAQLLQLVLIWALARAWHGGAWRLSLTLVPIKIGWRGWLGAILTLFAVKFAATLVANFIAPSNPGAELGPIVKLVVSFVPWLVFLVTVLLAGVTEELLFRGVLSRTLEATRLGFWGGAAAASAAFALLHMQYGPGGQLVIFAIGVALAWIRVRWGSLWPAIVCHAVNNGVALLAMRAVS